MKILLRAAGFIAFAVGTQFLAWLTGVDLLEDFNIFAIPRLWFLLGVAAITWVVIDAISSVMGSEAKRQMAFWALCGLCGLSASAVPSLLSQDGLAVGMMRFISWMWVITIGIYGALLGLGCTFWKKRREDEQAAS